MLVLWWHLLFILLHRSPSADAEEGEEGAEEEEGRVPSSFLRSQSSENLAGEALTLQIARWGVQV